MIAILWSLSLILIVAFQGSIYNPVELWGIRPDFILITIYFLGFFRGEAKGGLAGALLGFFMDVSSAGPVYINIFSKTFIGYMAGMTGRWVHNPGYYIHMGLVFLFSLIQGIITFIIFLFLGIAQFPDDIIYIAFPQAVVDGFSAGIIYTMISLVKNNLFQAVKS